MAMTTVANRTMTGKLTGKHTATLGKFEGAGATKTEAAAALHRAIEALDTRRAYVLCGDGDVLAISQHAPTGVWGYDMVRKVDAITARDFCASAWGEATYELAVEHAKEHAAQAFGGVVRVVRA